MFVNTNRLVPLFFAGCILLGVGLATHSAVDPNHGHVSRQDAPAADYGMQFEVYNRDIEAPDDGALLNLEGKIQFCPSGSGGVFKMQDLTL